MEAPLLLLLPPVRALTVSDDTYFSPKSNPDSNSLRIIYLCIHVILDSMLLFD